MKTLVVYRSRHGCAEKAARAIVENLNGEIEVINLKKNSSPILNDYSAVIIGGSIHAGSIQGIVKKFCQKNEKILLGKRLGLYLCCMEEGDTAQRQFEKAFPLSLRQHASATGIFGGEFDFEKMNFLEKLIIKKIVKISESISKFNPDAVKNFCNQVSN